MKRAMFTIWLLALTVTNLFSQQNNFPNLTDPGSTPALPGASSWSITLSGMVQSGGDDWIFWYKSVGSSSTMYDDHLGLNGVEGYSLGIDAALEYRITSSFALGVAVGYVPTKLHADAHYYVPNKSIQEVERPDARISYFPVRLTAGYDLFRSERWSIRMGVQCGAGIFGATDVPLNAGKSRRFYGDGSLLLGCQLGVTYVIAKGLAVTSLVQYQRTSFRVEELGTGDLKQTYHFEPRSLSLGLQYTLSD